MRRKCRKQSCRSWICWNSCVTAWNMISKAFLQYQPQVEADSGRIIAAEALARWHSSMYGNVSPVVFIPLLEKERDDTTIGKWIFETTLRQCAAWLKVSGFLCQCEFIYLQLYEEGFITFMKKR